MILRTLALAALFPMASFCQIQLFLFDGTNETAIGSSLNVGTAAVGQTVATIFRVRNVGTTSVSVTNISLSGEYFSLLQPSVPSLPYILAGGSFIDFEVDFSPASVAVSDSATLEVNTLIVVLRAAATPASQVASVYLDGATTALATGATIDFGSVQAGSSSAHSIRVDNSGGANAVAITVTGTVFQAATVSVAAGGTSTFQITFAPSSGQAFQSTLTVGQQSFILKGQGITPPAPAATIVVNNGSAVSSSQQVNVTIPLGAASQAIATGTLTLQFQSGVSGAADDPAIQFLSGAQRTASISILPGDTTGRINGNPSITLQTGTTAGSILLTLELGTSGSQVTIPIAPLPVNIESSAGVVGPSELTISLSGFDNTHSVSQLAFTFYDANDKAVSPGTITFDASSLFANYFSGGLYGGMFSLNAAFPVTGNQTLISTGQVAITNSAGVTQTQRIVF